MRTKFEVRSFTRSWDNMVYLKTLGSPWICRSGSSKVIDFGTNQKHVCDFLLVRHSNLGPILHRFGDIAGFLCSWVTHPYSTVILGVFPLHQIVHVGVSLSRSLKLFGCDIFEVFQPVWKSYLNITDWRTDKQTTYCVWHNRTLHSIAR